MLNEVNLFRRQPGEPTDDQHRASLASHRFNRMRRQASSLADAVGVSVARALIQMPQVTTDISRWLLVVHLSTVGIVDAAAAADS